MLDEKHKKESSSVIRQLISDNKIIKPDRETKQFFLEKGIESLDVAKRILKFSEDDNDPLSSYMWVVSASYYSMFFAATVLLAHFNHKINQDVGVHRLTFHALVHYFIVDDNKLQKHFIEQYKDAYTEAEELLQMSEAKAISMVKDFDYERVKRRRFTYEMGEIAELNKARTSVQRASDFLMEVRKIIQ